MDEKERIRRILAGEPESLRWFHDAHHGRLMAAAVYFLGYEDPECQDIVQETLLIGFQKLRSFEVRSTLYTWLAHICVNLCHDRMRKRKRVLLGIEADIEHLLASRAPHPDELREREEEEREQERRRRLVDKVFPLLGPPCREIMDLRDRQGLSYAEIGLRLNIPMGTVMSRLARCREGLRQLVERELEGNR